MDADRRELVQRLCALATEVAEGAHDAAVAGQAANAAPAQLASTAAELEDRGGELVALARAIRVALADTASSEKSS